jgi:hypothetical protein
MKNPESGPDWRTDTLSLELTWPADFRPRSPRKEPNGLRHVQGIRLASSTCSKIYEKACLLSLLLQFYGDNAQHIDQWRLKRWSAAV